MASLYRLLQVMVERGASELHVAPGAAPRLGVRGEPVLLRTGPLSAEDARALCFAILDDGQRRELEARSRVDLAFGVKGLARFRASVTLQGGAVAGTFRTVPERA